MMHLFLYEYLCGGALTGVPGAESLRREGRAMLAALLADFAACPDLRVTTLLDAAVAVPPRVRIERAGPDREGAFARLAAAADFTLVVAPEIDGILFRLCRTVEAVGGRLLGPSSSAVALTGDKFALVRHLTERGVPTPRCVAWPARELAPPLVCKPRDGAGSQATFLIACEGDRATAEGRAVAEGRTGPLLGQPFVPGLAASVALLIGPGRRLALPAARQHLSDDGRFRYLGGSLPLPDALDRRARALAERAVAAVEGLAGYVGVDLVLGATAADDRVIEINPRLTTSYVGLRALACFNLMREWLDVVTGRPLSEWRWRAGEVRFRANGAVDANEQRPG
jgi:predicted ATP-grasp superfamily ATP-dependent carboligase